MSEEGKDSKQPHYGTFQGVADYSLPQPTIGFPHPVPPPGAIGLSGQPSSHYYVHAYQAVPGYADVEGAAVRERRLPCCGIGCSWFLFDHREKPGYVACTLAAVLATIAVILGLTRNDWD